MERWKGKEGKKERKRDLTRQWARGPANLQIILKSSLLLRIHILKQSSRFITPKYKKTNGLGRRFITRVHMNPCSRFIISHVFAFPMPEAAPREGLA